jgi:hypothetical protein
LRSIFQTDFFTSSFLLSPLSFFFFFFWPCFCKGFFLASFKFYLMYLKWLWGVETLHAYLSL